MGKTLETLGIIDGFDITELGKLKSKKDKIFTEIEKYDKNIVNEVRDIVNNNKGTIIIITKKGIIHGIYVFKLEVKDDVSTLKYVKEVYTDEVKEETRKKYDDLVLELLKDSVSYQEYDNVTYKDEIIKLEGAGNKKETFIALIGGFLIGFLMIYLVTEELFLGIMMGIIFAPVMSGLEVVVQKKRGRKKNNSKDKKKDNA